MNCKAISKVTIVQLFNVTLYPLDWQNLKNLICYYSVSKEGVPFSASGENGKPPSFSENQIKTNHPQENKQTNKKQHFLTNNNILRICSIRRDSSIHKNITHPRTFLWNKNRGNKINWGIEEWWFHCLHCYILDQGLIISCLNS